MSQSRYSEHCGGEHVRKYKPPLTAMALVEMCMFEAIARKIAQKQEREYQSCECVVTLVSSIEISIW